MIVRLILIFLLSLGGCGQKIKHDEKHFEQRQKSSNLTKKINSNIEKKSTVKSQNYLNTPKMIQAKSKIYQSLQNKGITVENLDFFFHSDSNLRTLMREKLINTRDPYHLHLVWQRVKTMLEEDQWREGFNQTITILWNSSDELLRDQIINHLLDKPRLSKVGRTPWTAGEWLLNLKVARKYDLKLSQILKINQHHSRQWVRNYLSKRHNQNFGSNYLIWKRYLEQN